jgi:hypothetical protein
MTPVLVRDEKNAPLNASPNSKRSVHVGHTSR